MSRCLGAAWDVAGPAWAMAASGVGGWARAPAESGLGHGLPNRFGMEARWVDRAECPAGGRAESCGAILPDERLASSAVMAFVARCSALHSEGRGGLIASDEETVRLCSDMNKSMISAGILEACQRHQQAICMQGEEGLPRDELLNLVQQLSAELCKKKKADQARLRMKQMRRRQRSTEDFDPTKRAKTEPAAVKRELEPESAPTAAAPCAPDTQASDSPADPS